MGLVMYIGFKYSLPPIPVDVLETSTVVSYAKISSFTNIELLGLRLFDDLGFFLILAGYILLLAMVGAIVLTLGHEGEIKRQDIFEQVSRSSQVI